MTAYRRDRTHPQKAPRSADRPAAHDHTVHFYDEREAMIEAASAFLAGSLLRGGPALVITGSDRREAMLGRMVQMGVAVDEALAGGQLVMHESETILQQIVQDDVLDNARFREVIGPQVAMLTEAFAPRRLAAFGDMVDLLYAQDRKETAVALEVQWNAIASEYDFALHCAYDGRRMAKSNDRDAFDAICAQHHSIIPTRVPLPNP